MREPRWNDGRGAVARLLALALAVVLVAAACGSDDADEAEDATDAADTATTEADGAEEDAPTDDEEAVADDGEGAADDEMAEEAAASGELTSVRMAFNWVPDIEWAAWYLADDNGYFAEQGVDVEFVHGGPNTPAVSQIVAAGDAEIGVAADALEIITANAEGADYVAIAAMYQRGPLGLTWLAETDISTPEDLVGLRIGGPQGDQLQIEAMFEANGLPVDYEFVPMSFDPQPLVDGEMDAIASYVTNQPIQLELQGVETDAASYSDLGLPSYGDILFTSRSFLEENREAVVGFLAALLDGADDHRADPMAAIPLLTDVYGADAEINVDYAELGGPAYIDLMDSDYTDANGLLSMDPDRLAEEVFPAIELATGSETPAVDEFFDGSVLADAHASR